MEQPHEDTNWAELVKGQAAIQAARDFLRQGPNTGKEFLLCSQFKGAGFTAQETYYQELGFTTQQLLQAHWQLMQEQLQEARRQLVKEKAKAPKKRQYTEI